MPVAIEPDIQEAFLLIHDELSKFEVTWAVTGSLGFALQGIPTDVNDIDLQTDKEGAFEIERVLKAKRSVQIVESVSFSETTGVRSYFGALKVVGIEVEIMGEMQRKRGDGSWDRPTDLTKNRTFVKISDRTVPVMSLEYEVSAYEKLGRREKADFIKSYME